MAVLSALALAAPAAATTEAPAARALGASRPAAVHRVRIAAYGDSLMLQTNFYLRAAFDPATTDVQVRAIGGTALCDWVYPEMRTTSTGIVPNPAPGTILRLATGPDVAILEFAGNTFTPCITTTPFSKTSYLENYAVNLRAAIAHLLAIGTRLVVVDEGPPTRAELADPGSDELRQLYRRVVTSFANPDVVYASAADAADLTPSGSYAQTLPCLPLERRIDRCADVLVDGEPSNPVRSSDGIHFCPSTDGNQVGQVPGLCLSYASGAYRYATGLAELVQSRFPTTKPGASPVVDAVDATQGAATIRLTGFELSRVERVCFVSLAFPVIDGSAFSDITPAESATCTKPLAPPTAELVTVSAPTDQAHSNGGTFVEAFTASSSSIIGIATDALSAT